MCTRISGAAVRIPFWMHELQFAKEAESQMIWEFLKSLGGLERAHSGTLRFADHNAWLTGGKEFSAHVFTAKVRPLDPRQKKEQKFLDLERGRRQVSVSNFQTAPLNCLGIANTPLAIWPRYFVFLSVKGKTDVNPCIGTIDAIEHRIIFLSPDRDDREKWLHSGSR